MILFIGKNRKKTNSKERAFTLIELLIVIALMSIILSVSLFNHDRFGKEVELENDAYTLALTIRESQVYGINKKNRESGLVKFGEDYIYGVYFEKDTNTTNQIDESNFIIYRDEGSLDGKFTDVGSLNCTGAVSDECYSRVTLNRGNTIKDLEYSDGSNWSSATLNMDISFKRPDPDALTSTDGVSRGRVRVKIQDPSKQYFRCVEVGPAGDITINRC